MAQFMAESANGKKGAQQSLQTAVPWDSHPDHEQYIDMVTNDTAVEWLLIKLQKPMVHSMALSANDKMELNDHSF